MEHDGFDVGEGEWTWGKEGRGEQGRAGKGMAEQDIFLFVLKMKKMPVPGSVVVGVLVLNVFFTVLQVFWCGLLLKETKKMFVGGGEEDEKSE